MTGKIVKPTREVGFKYYPATIAADQTYVEITPSLENGEEFIAWLQASANATTFVLLLNPMSQSTTIHRNGTGSAITVTCIYAYYKAI